MMVVQELNQRDWVNRVAFPQNMLEIVADDAAIAMSDEVHFSYLGVLPNRTSVIGWAQIHGSFMNALSTLNV
jgi:hypothetical protein